MFKKIKEVCCGFKTMNILMVVLAVIAGVGIILSLVFGLKVASLKQEFSEIGPQEKLERLHAYALTLERFKEFQEKEGRDKTTLNLERAVTKTESGVLKALFDELVFGENLEKDMAYFEEAIIDSLEFLSR